MFHQGDKMNLTNNLPTPVEIEQTRAKAEGRSPNISPSESGNNINEEYRGNAGLCIILGLVGLIGGVYILLNPADSSAEIFGRSIVNQHRLVIGQTLTIVGAIFLAVGIRPR
jgi:hypothetical protein